MKEIILKEIEETKADATLSPNDNWVEGYLHGLNWVLRQLPEEG